MTEEATPIEPEIDLNGLAVIFFYELKSSRGTAWLCRNPAGAFVGIVGDAVQALSVPGSVEFHKRLAGDPLVMVSAGEESEHSRWLEAVSEA